MTPREMCMNSIAISLAKMMPNVLKAIALRKPLETHAVIR